MNRSRMLWMLLAPPLASCSLLITALRPPFAGEPPDPALCGNGQIDPGEACDDANDVPDDGCEEDCSPTDPVDGCGDGEPESGVFCFGRAASLIADGAFWVVSDDLDQDGDPDLATANRATSTAGVFLNEGGVLTASDFPTGGQSPFALAAGDVTGDGLPDLAITHQLVSNLTVLENQGGGEFAQLGGAISLAADPFFLLAADINEDGALDLVAPCTSGTVFFLQNQGDGSFLKASLFLDESADGAAAGDFDNDGDQDLAIASSSADGVILLENDGAGGFFLGDFFATGNGPESVVSGDLDADGRPDLVVPNANDGSVVVLFGEGALSFSAPLRLLETDDLPQSAALGDFDGDGDLDIVVAHLFSTSVHVHENDGGAFPRTVALTVGESPFSAVAADLNGDGIDDLGVVESGDSALGLLLSNP